ncbi:NAD(P)-binding protein [Rhizodiscina lignyota]|uniref:NAD(P)-binding protein n=1 Tax=Rhizodiscina lignyota TaxID=1504668 RepID=A0A9P4IU28_9PEZI|nr:NAD(P)-binding protein [Rhizodiscina lignyota]
MPLTILTDQEVKKLLHSLSPQDILVLQQSLADALHYYSANYEDETVNGCSASYQPHRTVVKRKDGQTTLVMPATSDDAMGVKVVTLGESKETSPTTPPMQRSSVSSSATVSTMGSMSSLSISDSPRSPTTASSGTSPKGSLTIFDSSGSPRALMNAEEITAFRTALASLMLFKKRETVHDVTIFGAGKQAYWHLRLALLLRGPEVHHINIINRSFERAQQLVHDLIKSPQGADLPHPKIAIITPGHQEYERLLKSTIRASAVIFATTPSAAPLFPASYLTSTEGRRKGRYIAAVGSYKPHMIEIHPDIIKQAVAPSHSHHHHKHAKQGGAIVVDSVESCLKEAGEVIQAGLGGREVVELGELMMLKKDAEARRKAAEQGLDAGGVEITGGKGDKNPDGGLMEWLQKGNVIYKSVGLGLMDVVVGGDLVKLAEDRGMGTTIQNF